MLKIWGVKLEFFINKMNKKDYTKLAGEDTLKLIKKLDLITYLSLARAQVFSSLSKFKGEKHPTFKKYQDRIRDLLDSQNYSIKVCCN